MRMHFSSQAAAWGHGFKTGRTGAPPTPVEVAWFAGYAAGRHALAKEIGARPTCPDCGGEMTPTTADERERDGRVVSRPVLECMSCEQLVLTPEEAKHGESDEMLSPMPENEPPVRRGAPAQRPGTFRAPLMYGRRLR